MTSFNRLLFITLCLSFFANAMPVPSTDIAGDEFNAGLDLEGRGLFGLSKPKSTTAKNVAVKTPAAKTVLPVRTTAAATALPTATTTTTNSPACALKPKAKSRSTVERLANVRDNISYNIKKLFGRVPTPGVNDEEFIGFHGTNSGTASLWESSGSIVRPPGPKGVFDFLALTATKGTSGADAELGPGLYIADELFLATNFATINAKNNPGTTAKVCAIFAKSSGNWRNAIPKAMLPDSVVGDNSDQGRAQKLENARTAYLKAIGLTPQSVKFSIFAPRNTGQMLLPELLNSQFSAKCFDASAVTSDGHGGFTVPAAQLPAGVIIPGDNSSWLSDVLQELFGSTTRRAEWKIQAEDKTKAEAVSVKNCL
ncbi:hypothetical protein EW146_g3116 [Bondarzewia mesenterica]|uniref:Uncharacterized protein n=1 Tax=Bondarzewia mesenterica TaxID=1095465 RepID=A0A4S4M014_9AGAM|nr:hypothetical protein EW146_g3116 [Bondarzewia mesenterica]